jgi:hypothetical protein
MTRSHDIDIGRERPAELSRVLEHAQRLSDAPPESGGGAAAWFHEALHVGDVSVLALAFAADRR